LRIGSIDLRKDAAAAAKMSKSTYYDYIKTGGGWDFKNNIDLISALRLERVYNGHLLAEFGNLHFGMTAAARGYALSFTLSGAGVYQAFKQGGGNKIAAIAGAHLAAQQALSSEAGGPRIEQINEQFTRAITRQGFTWGDLPDDPPVIIRGWDYYHAN
jgi:hypothetical protein